MASIPDTTPGRSRMTDELCHCTAFNEYANFWGQVLPALCCENNMMLSMHSSNDGHSPKRASCRCPTLASIYGHHAQNSKLTSLFPIPPKLLKTDQQQKEKQLCNSQGRESHADFSVSFVRGRTVSDVSEENGS